MVSWRESLTHFLILTTLILPLSSSLPSLSHTAEQNSMSSEDELQFSEEDDEGSHSVAVDHYESLVNILAQHSYTPTT